MTLHCPRLWKTKTRGQHGSHGIFSFRITKTALRTQTGRVCLGILPDLSSVPCLAPGLARGMVVQRARPWRRKWDNGD